MREGPYRVSAGHGSSTNRRPWSPLTRAGRVIWGVTGVLAHILGFFMNIGGCYSDWKGRRLPDVDIAFFEETSDGRLEIVDPNEVQVLVGGDEVLSGRIPITLNLAIRNTGSEVLEVVRVELSYDSGLEVASDGKAKIDPDNRLLIYEHEIGTLEDVNQYTPLETIDTVYVPFNFKIVPAIVVSRDGVPEYYLAIDGYEDPTFAAKTVSFGLKVYSRDRPTVNGLVTFHIQPGIGLVTPYDVSDSIQQSIAPDDLQLFRDLSSAAVVTIEQWKVEQPNGGHLISYHKVRFRNGIYQVILVDGQMRKVIGDDGADGTVEWLLWDQTFDGVPDRKFSLTPPSPMIDWPKHAAR